jgi:hypothetical protein
MRLFRSDTGIGRAEVAFQDRGGAGRMQPECDRVADDEDLPPPPVAVLAFYLLEHPPAGSMHVHLLGATRADRVLQRDQQSRGCFQCAEFSMSYRPSRR